MSDVVKAVGVSPLLAPRRRKRAPRGLLVAAGLCALLVLMPLAFTVYRAVTFGWDDAVELIFRPLVGELLINTLSITVSATLVSAVVGRRQHGLLNERVCPGVDCGRLSPLRRLRCPRSSRVMRGSL